MKEAEDSQRQITINNYLNTLKQHCKLSEIKKKVLQATKEKKILKGITIRQTTDSPLRAKEAKQNYILQSVEGKQSNKIRNSATIAFKSKAKINIFL